MHAAVYGIYDMQQGIWRWSYSFTAPVSLQDHRYRFIQRNTAFMLLVT